MGGQPRRVCPCRKQCLAQAAAAESWQALWEIVYPQPPVWPVVSSPPGASSVLEGPPQWSEWPQQRRPWLLWRPRLVGPQHEDVVGWEAVAVAAGRRALETGYFVIYQKCCFCRLYVTTQTQVMGKTQGTQYLGCFLHWEHVRPMSALHTGIVASVPLGAGAERWGGGRGLACVCALRLPVALGVARCVASLWVQGGAVWRGRR